MVMQYDSLGISLIMPSRFMTRSQRLQQASGKSQGADFVAKEHTIVETVRT